MMTIYKTVFMFVAFTCVARAQEVPAIWPVQLPNTEALYQQLLRSNIEGSASFIWVGKFPT